MRTSNYSDFLTHVSALIGVDQADFQTTELTFLNSYFNKAIRQIWERNNWTDLCPKGEVRFPINLITYPNDLTQSNWTLTNATATAQALANPLDNRITASSLVETSATGVHGYSQIFAAIPNVTYAANGYVRPNGRSYLYVSLSDGSSTWTAFFNFLTGTVGPTTGIGITAGIQKQANGFWYWNVGAASSASAGTGTLSVQLSPDGATTSYAGTAGVGAYVWGTTLGTPNSMIPAAYYIPWEQLGENPIDVLFDAWTTDPGSFLPPYRGDYTLTPNGIELIGPTSIGPVYLWYRLRRPIFTGATYSASSAYAAGLTLYFTSSTGYGNYYQTLSATTAGQSPDTNPALWSMLTIPYIFFEYCVFSSYADWLEVEGQTMKAQAIRQHAQTYLEDETDRLERQAGDIMPWRVYTHLTSQNRGLGYVGQNFNAGTATID